MKLSKFISIFCKTNTFYKATLLQEKRPLTEQGTALTNKLDTRGTRKAVPIEKQML